MLEKKNEEMDDKYLWLDKGDARKNISDKEKLDNMYI